MNKINKKITLFSLLTCGLLGASGGGDSSPQIDSNGLTRQVFGSVSREGYFPSVSNFKTCGEAVIADRKINEYKKYFGLQSLIIDIFGNRNDESQIEYVNDMKKGFLMEIWKLFFTTANNPKIMPFKESLGSMPMYFNHTERTQYYNQYIQDHLLDILMALTSDNPIVAALGLPPVDETQNKEKVIDQILGALAPELDKCDKDMQNCFLARLINVNRNDPRIVALELLTENEINEINEINKIDGRDGERAIRYILDKISRIEDKKQAINHILDIMWPNDRIINHYAINIFNGAYNCPKNNMELIASIRRNRLNIKELDVYFNLLYNRRDAQLKIESLRDLLANRDNEGLRQTAAIMQTAKGFNQNSE